MSLPLLVSEDNVAELHCWEDRETNRQTNISGLPAARPWGGNMNSLPVSPVRVSRIWLQHHQWQNSASLDQLPQEVSKCQCKYTSSPIWHTAGASWKTQHQAVQAPEKHTLKYLQMNPSPVEVGSSDRDPSTSSSSHWIHYGFIEHPGQRHRVCFLPPWHCQSTSPAETSPYNIQKHPQMT